MLATSSAIYTVTASYYSVVIYIFTWDDPLLYGLYIGVPSVCFRDT